MLTGLIDFQGKTCVFKMNKESFTLEIEEIEDRENLPFSSLEFLFDKKTRKVFPKENLLIAKDFERDQLIHFKTKFVRKVAAKTYTAHVESYVIFVGNLTLFDGLKIQANELNWFYNIGQAVEQSTYNVSGEAQLQIKPFDKTTEEFEFNFNGSLIKGNLSIGRGITTTSTRPLELNSNLIYYFDETTDFSIAKNLVHLTEELLQFLSYRKNLHINSLILTKIDAEDGKSFSIGELFINNTKLKEKEEDRLVRERIISYPLLKSSFTKLLEKISEKTIYVKHIPESSKSTLWITPARFIMATAGFEWQFEFSHKELSKESEKKYEKQRNEILEFLEDKVEKSIGKEKKFFDNAKTLFIINKTTLATKIIWAFKESDEVLKDFIDSVYSANDIETTDYAYNKIAERIQKERNAIAHGNLTVESNKFLAVDFLVLEWLYYAMVLDDIGISKENAKKCINDLFKRKFILEK